MNEPKKKCKGKTKRGDECNKYPLMGEEFCELHHPVKRLKRKIVKCHSTYITIIVAILIFLIQDYTGKENLFEIKGSIQKHSFAERLLSNKNNPFKMADLTKEFANLVNNDPYFDRRFVFEGNEIDLVTNLQYDKDFRIVFKNQNKKSEFEKFVKGGQRKISIKGKDYTTLYLYKDGEIVDSLMNRPFDLKREFPTLPIVNISTINPTEDYICASNLHFNVDSIVDQNLFISNYSQESTLKISLTFDLINKVFDFDMINGIGFDPNSLFYSIDQEISYYKLLKALCKNAKIRIRDGIAGNIIYTSDPFIPSNLDLYESITKITGKINALEKTKY
ncbi:MAG: hypothetical protein GY853_15015 [PVC group bacterium]|nr:hypothetical protein [PVC group bacterium]